MEFNKLIFGGLALGCLTAAAGGGYLAARQNATTEIETPIATAPAPSAPVVSESEGVIAPAAPVATTPAVAPAPAFDPPVESPAPRRETATRPLTTPTTPRPEPARPVEPQRRATRNEPVASSAPTPAPSNNGSMWEPRPAVEPDPSASSARETVADPEPPAPPAPEFVDLVIPADAVLGLQIERTISSEVARVEDRVEARVTRDVRVGNRVAIPAGAMVHGSVAEVERGGKVKEKARLGIRFHTVVLGDGTRLNIKTDSVVREGTSPAAESAGKIGGAAAGGAILGAILGGGKGAAIGGAIGAAGGTAATMSGGRNPAILPAGTTVSVRVQSPVNVTVEK